MEKIVITSGYYNPLHKGHINLMREAKELGDFLVVIVNNDQQVTLKGSAHFIDERERMEIIASLKYVDDVFLSVDEDLSVAKSLECIAKKYSGQELFFAKGGDRNSSNIPQQEKQICKQCNINIVNNVGGPKVQSSSWLLKNKDKVTN